MKIQRAYTKLPLVSWPDIVFFFGVMINLSALFSIFEVVEKRKTG